MRLNKTAYLAIGLAGTALTYSQYVPYLLDGGGIAGFFQLAFSNRVSAGLSFDLLATGAAALVFMAEESNRLKVPNLWAALAAIPTVGFCLGLPLFLYFREEAMERQTTSQ